MVATMGRRSPRRGAAVLMIAAALAGAVGGAMVLERALDWPEGTGPLAADPQAGLRVQSVLAQLLLREARLSSRQDPLVLSAAEVNAFITGHVEVRDAPVWPVRVQIDRDGVELAGPTTLGRLIEAGLGSALAGKLPRPIGGHPVWIGARGQIALASPGQAEFLAHTATIGRQRVPVSVLWRAVGGRPRALVWRMPRIVERVDIEPGRLLIYTRRPGASRGLPG
ncbi:MAG TPA: hypothetical protein VGR13_05345 [Actinomycetota bacterium]|nr:hypothetical protein [Actinomycetota bacterium]